MEWNRSETLAMASEKCLMCAGEGLRYRKGEPGPCSCVLREIFKACYRKFVQLSASERSIGKLSMERISAPERKTMWCRKSEEYLADFYLVSKRSLTEEEFKIFRYYYLLAADWRLCCRKLQMSQPDFFRVVYNIQTKLGRVFRELKPHSLYPLEDYFGGPAPDDGSRVVAIRTKVRRPSLSEMVPLKRSA